MDGASLRALSAHAARGPACGLAVAGSDPPWTLLAPALLLVTTLACFQQLGDGLRDALDVRNAAASEVVGESVPATES